MTCPCCTPRPAPSPVEHAEAVGRLRAAGEDEQAALSLYDHDHTDDSWRRVRDAVLVTERARRDVARLERAMREEVTG